MTRCSGLGASLCCFALPWRGSNESCLGWKIHDDSAARLVVKLAVGRGTSVLFQGTARKPDQLPYTVVSEPCPKSALAHKHSSQTTSARVPLTKASHLAKPSPCGEKCPRVCERVRDALGPSLQQVTQDSTAVGSQYIPSGTTTSGPQDTGRMTQTHSLVSWFLLHFLLMLRLGAFVGENRSFLKHPFPGFCEIIEAVTAGVPVEGDREKVGTSRGTSTERNWIL